MFEKRLTAKAQRTQRRNIFIAFAETPKAINLQPSPAKKRDLRQAVGFISPGNKCPTGLSFFLLPASQRQKKSAFTLRSPRL
jgi:hypothetical protein